jgi:hypothetical protein
MGERAQADEKAGNGAAVGSGEFAADDLLGV